MKFAPLFLAMMTVALLAACASAPAAPTPTSAPLGKKFDPKPWAGTYKGTWTNQTTGATGAATATISIDDAKKEATIIVDMDGPYLGLVEAPPQTFVTKYDDTMAKLDGNNILFGEFKITVDADGKVIGAFKNLAGGLVPEMSYTGLIGNSKLDFDYKVKLANGSEVNSILRMTKQ